MFDVKNNFLKIKNIILIHFRVKSTLKNNRNHTHNTLVVKASTKGTPAIQI